MYPELINLPGGFGIKTYGFCLMVGFLSAVWLAMRRAERVKADPDIVLNLSFIALLFGVGGARLFYVIHYWQTQFAGRPRILLEIVDIRQGGLEFLGGFLGATTAMMFYLSWKRQSIRMYLDIMAPGCMWGLAFGRIGCFFNGCCYGAVCVAGAAHDPGLPWAVRFPYGSPAHLRHWEERQLTLPAELVATSKESLQPSTISESSLNMSVEKREGPRRVYELAKDRFEKAKALDPASKETVNFKAAMEAAYKKAEAHEIEILSLRQAQKYPSRNAPERTTSVSELQELAGQHRSLPVHPTQLYEAAYALILSWFLSAVFYARKRHGIVITLLIILYPIGRFVLERIRADNPHDVGGFTISQFLSISLFALGIVLMVWLFKMPQRSPYADAALKHSTP